MKEWNRKEEDINVMDSESGSCEAGASKEGAENGGCKRSGY